MDPFLGQPPSLDSGENLTWRTDWSRLAGTKARARYGSRKRKGGRGRGRRRGFDGGNIDRKRQVRY